MYHCIAKIIDNLLIINNSIVIIFEGDENATVHERVAETQVREKLQLGVSPMAPPVRHSPRTAHVSCCSLTRDIGYCSYSLIVEHRRKIH